MKGVHMQNTDVGPISLATLTCDYCKKVEPDDRLGWIEVRKSLVVYGDWGDLDFCSESCLRSYFEPTPCE
jgi:hypothetical protein